MKGNRLYLSTYKRTSSVYYPPATWEIPTTVRLQPSPFGLVKTNYPANNVHLNFIELLIIISGIYLMSIFMKTEIVILALLLCNLTLTNLIVNRIVIFLNLIKIRIILILINFVIDVNSAQPLSNFTDSKTLRQFRVYSIISVIYFMTQSSYHTHFLPTRHRVNLILNTHSSQWSIIRQYKTAHTIHTVGYPNRMCSVIPRSSHNISSIPGHNHSHITPIYYVATHFISKNITHPTFLLVFDNG